MNSTDEKISIIIVGESSVGKTSLLNQYNLTNLDIQKEYFQVN